MSGERSLRRSFAALVLVSEVLVIGFATLVAVRGLPGVGAGTSAAAGGGLALLCLLAAGLLRSRVGYALGWLVQVLLVASALWLRPMLLLGLLFAGMWAVALVQGSRMDALTRARAQEQSTGPR